MSSSPIVTVRSSAAYGLSIAIWGSGSDGKYNLKIQKSYKAKDETWKTTEYLTPQDLAGLAQLIPIALAHCDRMKAAQKLQPVQQQSIESRFNLPPKDVEQPPPYTDDDIPF